MFWVVTEVCSEINVVKRSKIIKHFIKIASKFVLCAEKKGRFVIVKEARQKGGGTRQDVVSAHIGRFVFSSTALKFRGNM